jgi:hypothetical protein
MCDHDQHVEKRRKKAFILWWLSSTVKLLIDNWQRWENGEEMSICFKGEAVLERWDFGRMLSERGILYDVMILHLSKGRKTTHN